MSLQDVLANVIYDSPNPGDIAAIEASLASIYGTLEGRVMLDLSVSSGRHLIFRNNEGGGNSAELGSQVVRYDLPGVADVSFISSKGNIVQYPIAAALAHELAHAILSLDDVKPLNYVTPGQDYVGETVDFVNAIHAGLGIEDRNSYLGFVYNSDLNQIGMMQGQSLSDGKTVGLVLVNNSNEFSVMDTSDRGDAVVLVGLDLNDTITSGAGDDYLYGGDGDDILQGSIGKDVVHGNAGEDFLVGNSGAPIDTSALDLSVAHSDWNDNERDTLYGDEGHDTYLIYSSFRTGEATSPEEYADIRNNKLDFIDAEDTDFTAHFQFLDAVDKLNTFTLTDELVQHALESYDGEKYNFGSMTFTGDFGTWVGKVTGSEYGGDLILSVSTYFTFRAFLGGLLHFSSLERPATIGTEGDDYLNGSAGNDKFYGAGGNDTFYGGGGDDLIDGDSNGPGSRANMLLVSRADDAIDVAEYDGQRQDYTFTANEDGSVAVVNSLYGTDTLLNIEQVYFYDEDEFYDLSQLTSVSTLSDSDAIMSVGSSSLAAAKVKLTSVTSGDDLLIGTDADDTFVFRGDFGKDTIVNFTPGANSDDIIDVSADVFADFAAIMAVATEDGSDTLITQDINNSILLRNVALTTLHQDDFRFAA
jgi:Ca2+-binding RTX toxin-like protein